MTRTSLTSNSVINDAASFQTATITPHANTLILLYVTSSTTLFGGNPSVPTITGNGLAWAQVNSIPFGGANDHRLSCFRAMGAAPAAGILTIDFGGQVQDFCAWSVFEFDGVDPSGTSGSGAVKQANAMTGNGASLTVAIAAPTAGNASAGGIALDAPATVTAGAGLTEIHEQTVNQFLGKGAALQTQDSTGVPAVSWTWNPTANSAAIAVEIKAAPSSVTPTPTPIPANDEALVRRFEPVLFLHPDEKFFPVDVKRYIEHCALWSTTSPFDDKSGWRRVVQARGLAAVESEAGAGDVYLGDALGDGTDERFLELGGWKDRDESAEPDVSASTTNLYANRNAIIDVYRNDLELSRFWYHAEVFDTERLKRLAGGPPDLRKTLTGFGLKHPTLLCYYLFFPAHEQSVVCDGISAAELGCHAGDWQCITILLEGDGSQDAARYTPKYFGHTGSRPTQVDVNGTTQYRPHQFDAENLTVMKVEEWRANSGPLALQPEVNGDHPRLYVASGTHGLYMKSGDHDVDPYPAGSEPRGCGGYDNPGLAPPGTPGEERSTLEIAAIIAKFVTCGFGLSFVGGWVAGILEIIEGSPDFGSTGPGNDTPKADQAPASPGQSVVVRPADFPIPDAGDRVENWRTKQRLPLNGRTYDFIVDRDTQVWWPHDDNERGFRGRWGQRVSDDPLPRRAGPKFPNYVDMFLRGLADGITRGFFKPR
jgi:hypothetical protein